MGDGTSKQGEVVRHEYGQKGEYTVKLTAQDDCGYKDSESKTFLWLEFNGTEVNHSAITAPSNRWDLKKDQSKTDQCVYNGEKRSEATRIDVGKDKPTIELGGHSNDTEVCVSDSNSGA
jgi:PKD repeat protein